MAPKEIRGKLGSMFHFLFTCGVMTSYWIDYVVSENIPPISRQWQIPIGLQVSNQRRPSCMTPWKWHRILSAHCLYSSECSENRLRTVANSEIMIQLVPGGILGLGMLLTRESTRWLAKAGKTDQALESLIWVRGGEDTTEVREEFIEILAGIREEEQATDGITLRELWLPVNRFRLMLAMTLQLGAQLTGNTSLAYFEGIGRRGSLLGGAFFMGTFMLIIAALSAKYPPVEGRGVTPTGAASTVGTATQWLFNFAFSQITPRAIEGIGWKTFLMFCIFNWALVAYTWLFIKEVSKFVGPREPDSLTI
ncbi:hypothetical protein SLS62_009411 [Diatrype stigma]|uniref:Uncharacterized protein n=1 Tax=Diatrype stigma TaxID=117547 RepID=A0AAN9UF87_9PEZI